MAELVAELGKLGVEAEKVVDAEDVADATTEVEDRVSSDKLMIRERTQIVMKTDKSSKLELFQTILESIPSFQTMVFCETKRDCNDLVTFLAKIGIVAKAMYSFKEDMKGEENKIKDEFKSGDLRVMVCTDYVARGYDVPCELVICYDLPYIFDERKRCFGGDVEFEKYAHRTARTARAGRFGTIINLLEGAKDSAGMDSIAERFKMRIEGAGSPAEGSSQLTDILFKEWKSDTDSVRELQDYIDSRKAAVEEFNRGQSKGAEVKVEDGQGGVTSMHLNCDLQYSDTTFGLDHFDGLPAHMKANLDKIRRGIVVQKQLATAFPIQAKVYPFAMVDPSSATMTSTPHLNVFAQAEGGSGKTLAYIASMLAKLDVSSKKLQAVCIVHNGSLLEQVCKDYLEPVQKEFPEFTFAAGKNEYFKKLKGQCAEHVIVGTPEAIANRCKAKVVRGERAGDAKAPLDLSAVTVCVIDEVDDYFTTPKQEKFLGEVIKAVQDAAGKKCQFLLFSATYPDEARAKLQALIPGRRVDIAFN
jgi:superfamily II DNA/RNA helicase